MEMVEPLPNITNESLEYRASCWRIHVSKVRWCMSPRNKCFKSVSWGVVEASKESHSSIVDT